jgi:hypothetical protein
MRKAFDANVPKLKPRLRPAIAVVSGSVQEKRNEDTTITAENLISGTDTNLQGDVLNNDSVNLSDQESTVDDSFTETAEDDIPVEISLKDTHLAAHEEMNGVAIAAEALTNSETFEENTESPDNGILQEKATSDIQDLRDAAILDSAQIDITDKQVLLTENLAGDATVTLPGIKNVFSEKIVTPHTASVPGIDDSDTRRKRLEEVKRKVSDAVRPEVRIEPVPEDPTLAVESVLGLVSDLEAQLSRSREVEKALRSELAEAKSDLTQIVNDGRTASGRLIQVEAMLDEKRKVLEEMLFEMGALEEERDQAVRMVQMLTIREKDRVHEIDTLRHDLTEMQRVVDENRVEEERLSCELDEYVKENNRLHTLLTEVTKERDMLADNTEHLTKERDDLIKAKKALEKVHIALSQARARLRE